VSTFIRPGDTVFVRSGEPMTVLQRDAATGVTKLERDPETIKNNTRHGYINGLSLENRKIFNEILDEVKSNTEIPEERVQKLRDHLSEIEQDPKQMILARYLRSEMIHIMNSHGLKPKEFTVHDSRVR
jgi:uncharacterized membrane protein